MKKTFPLVFILALGMIAEVANADFIFGEPTNMGPTVNASANDFCPRVSTDGLSLFFPSVRAGGVGGLDIWVTTRATKDDPWGAPVNLGATVNSSSDDYSLSISADGLALYFVSKRPGGSGGYDAWVTTRVTKNDPWAAPVNLGPTVNSSSDDYSLNISTDGLTLHFTSNRGGGSGGHGVYVTTRQTTSDLWGVPVNLGPTVNGSSNEYTLGVSADGLALYVVSDRGGGSGSLDIWVTRRTTANDDWGALVNLGPKVNSSAVDGFPGPSADGLMLYFSSNRPGGSEASIFGRYQLRPSSISTATELSTPPTRASWSIIGALTSHCLIFTRCPGVTTPWTSRILLSLLGIFMRILTIPRS